MRGVGRPRPSRDWDGDLDLDASLPEIVSAFVENRPPDVDELVTTQWARPDLALCLAIDTSGSMTGDRLATAAVAAAACALRAPDDLSVLTFDRDVTTVRPMGARRDPRKVAVDLLALKGHGTTDLTRVLTRARQELIRSPARRKAVILLSDCRHNANDSDPIAAARRLPGLLIMCPAGDDVSAREFSQRAGALTRAIAEPSDVPGTLTLLLAKLGHLR
jgi:Mg-chelatase subunit ChlD